MRPIDLTPPEERRGGRSGLRTGSLSYVIVGALALALVAVVALALTSKQISDREDEQARLEGELQVATAKAQSLRAFADFRAVQERRQATVASLAESRFDWERVMRELALVIPPDVWLIKLTGTVSPAVQVEGGSAVETRADVPGPALELVGCAPSQDAVAGFIAALEDIDGVTRVGIDSSQQPDDAAGGVTAGSAGDGSSDDCRTRAFIYQFQIVVAFDAVPTPATATEAPSVPVPPAPGSDPQLADAQAGQAAATDSAAEQSAKAEQAANLIPGG